MLNKVTLIGNLGQDVEIRFLPNGIAAATLSLATTRRWKDKQTGEKKVESEWHRVVFFGKQAEIAGEYLKKGSQIYVEGRLKTREWEKDGHKNYTTEIIGETFLMTGGKPQTGQQTSQQQSRPKQGSQPREDNMSSYDDFDQDIPF